MTVTASRQSAPHKQTPERLGSHAPTVSAVQPSSERKVKKTRKRPFGIVPTRIARVERHLEALIALKDDSKLIRRTEHIEAILDRHEEQALSLYGSRKIGFARYKRTCTKACELRSQLRAELLRRANDLDTRIIPEVQNLCTQAERAA